MLCTLRVVGLCSTRRSRSEQRVRISVQLALFFHLVACCCLKGSPPLLEDLCLQCIQRQLPVPQHFIQILLCTKGGLLLGLHMDSPTERCSQHDCEDSRVYAGMAENWAGRKAQAANASNQRHADQVNTSFCWSSVHRTLHSQVWWTGSPVIKGPIEAITLLGVPTCSMVACALLVRRRKGDTISCTMTRKVQRACQHKKCAA